MRSGLIGWLEPEPEWLVTIAPRDSRHGAESPGNFNRADQAARIFLLDPGGAARVKLFQHRVKFCRRFFFQRAAKRCVRLYRGQVEAIDECVNPECGAARDDGDVSGPRDFPDCAARGRDILRRAECTAHRGNAEQVMGYAAGFFFGDNAAADFKTAVYLSRVGGDDFPVEFLGESHRKRRLAGRGRSDYDDDSWSMRKRFSN